MSNTSEDKLLMASTWFSSKQSMEKQQLLCLLESKLEADNRAIYHRL
jgi:hypothetical protein